MTADVTSGPAPVRVSFTNTSQNADQFQWDFGDGRRITTLEPTELVTHEYTKAGSYTITMTAVKKGDRPQPSLATVSVTVSPGLLDRVTIEPAALTIEASKQAQFTGKAFDRFDNLITSLKPAFRTHGNSGAVDGEGKFTAATKAGAYEGGLTMEFVQGGVTKTGRLPASNTTPAVMGTWSRPTRL